MSKLAALLLAFLCRSLFAQTVDEILHRYMEADKQNNLRAQPYVYTSRQEQFQFDKQGHVKNSRSKTFEDMFVEGERYRKLVAVNDQPLSPKEAAKEEERLRKTREERREARHSGIFQKTVTSARSSELPQLYHCRLDGEGEEQGRPVWVLQCDPRQDHSPVDDHEKDLLTFQQRLWIDKAEAVSLKLVNTALDGNSTLLPGSTMSWEYTRIHQDAWLPTTLRIDGHAKFAGLYKPQVRTEYVNTNFKKFDVQSTITPQNTTP